MPLACDPLKPLMLQAVDPPVFLQGRVAALGAALMLASPFAGAKLTALSSSVASYVKYAIKIDSWSCRSCYG